jgi:thiol-disulfide isomerase/thioredoxin
MRNRPFIANLDMYRKVPVDLLEGTRRGSILSTIAVATMTILFLLETKAFFSTQLKTNLALDSNEDSQIRVNFNITMMDLKCEFATIDVVSVLGTQQNVTQHVQKYPIDQSGVRRTYSQRNRQQHDVQLFDATVEETIEELHADGEDAVSLDETTFNIALEENEYVFVDFFANWCSHCRDLAPTWETLAEVMYQAAENRVEEYEDVHTYSDEDYNEAMKVELPVLIAKVDCVDHHDFCMDQEIRAYPTLKFFVDGEEKGVYNGHRTVVEFTHFIAEMEKEHKGHKHPDLKSGEIKESEYKFVCILLCLLLSVLMHCLNLMEFVILPFHQTQSQPIVQFKQKNTRTTLEHSPPPVINTNPPGMRKNIQDVNFLASYSLIVHLAIFTSKPNLVVTTLPLT